METHTTPVCSECPGRCCSNRRWIFGFVRLTMAESEHQALAPHVQWFANPDDPKRGLPYMSLQPKCPFLQKDNRCGIYEERPKSCRSYVCHEDPQIETYLETRPTHRRLLSRWKVLPGQKNGIENQHRDEKKSKVYY